jgi:hypothetical protein
MSSEDSAYPNHDSDDNSPEVAGLGVAVRLAPPSKGAIHPIDKPLILNAAYNGTATMERQTRGAPLTKTIVVVERLADGALLQRPVRDAAPELPVVPAPSDPQESETRVGGYFNLDLTEFLPELDEPGRYRLWAEFFDFKSEVIEFELGFEE